MGVPRLGVKSELQLLAYATATAMQDPSSFCNLHHSSQQCRIPDPLSEARDQTHILMDTSRICFRSAARGTPQLFKFKFVWISSPHPVVTIKMSPNLGKWPLGGKIGCGSGRHLDGSKVRNEDAEWVVRALRKVNQGTVQIMGRSFPTQIGGHSRRLPKGVDSQATL